MNCKTNSFLLLESMMVHVPVVIPFPQYITIFPAHCSPAAEKCLAQALDLPLASSAETPSCTQGYKGTEGQFVLDKIKFYERWECAYANKHAGGEAATCPQALPVISTDTDVGRAMSSLIILLWFWCPSVISWLGLDLQKSISTLVYVGIKEMFYSLPGNLFTLGFREHYI